ncbi:MAG: hypothetical protein R3Y43_02070 [Alphaproteobacteria bacterium]
MKLRTAVLTSAFVMFAAASHAADITSPFYLPMEGQMLSDTYLETSRFKGENASGTIESLSIKEKIGLGVTNDWMAYVALANNFDYGGSLNNDLNFDYTIGTAYNMDHQNFKSQIGLAYRTFKPESFYGHQYIDSSNWNKYIEFNAKIGYKMPCSWMMPYLDITATYALNTVAEQKYVATINAPSQGDLTYSTFAGAHMWWQDTTADLGFRWDNVHQDKELFGGNKTRDDIYLEGKLNFLQSENSSIGIYGQYLIGDSDMPNVDYGYVLGANYKIVF